MLLMIRVIGLWGRSTADPISPEVVEAGVNALCEYSFGDDWDEIVTQVYYAREYKRRRLLNKHGRLGD